MSNCKREITIFMPNLFSGGAERMTLNLVAGFIDRGINVTLLLATPVVKLKKYIHPNVNVVHLNCKRTLYSIPKLAWYIKKHKPKNLLSHINRANRVALIAALLIRSDTRVHVVEHNTVSVRISNYSIIPKLLILFFYKFVYRSAANIIHVSKTAADDLQKMVFKNKINVKYIYNPIVDEKMFNDINEKPPHPWLKNKNIPVILGVGSLRSQKDFLNLINAFSILKQNKQARLIILGEGEERNIIEKSIIKYKLQDCVDIPGYVDNPLQYMRYASVFVLSSRTEALPTALVEAMACGCPVVSTDCPSGPAEILDNGKYGPLVPIKNPSALSDAIMKSLANPIPKKVLRARAMEFSKVQSVDKYIKMLGI